MVFIEVKPLQMFRYFSEGRSILEAEMTSWSNFTLSDESLLKHINQNCIFCLWLWKVKSICYSCPSSLPLHSSIISSAAEQDCPPVVKKLQFNATLNLWLLQRSSAVCRWLGGPSCAGGGCVWPASFASEELLQFSGEVKGMGER